MANTNPQPDIALRTHGAGVHRAAGGLCGLEHAGC